MRTRSCRRPTPLPSVDTQPDGTVLRTFTHHTDKVTSLALLPDGLRFVSGSVDDTARVAYHGLAPQQ